MGYSTWTTDELEQELISDESERSRLAAKDLAILEELDYRQVASADGCRSLSEWTTARLDIHPDNAKSLVRTMRRTAERPDLRGALASGEISFDRMEALSRIPEDVGHVRQLDVAGVRREAANRVRITAEDEYRTARDQFLVMQPSLDASWWKLWGGIEGAAGALVDKVLSERADELPALPDGTRGDSSWRKAIALAELCVGNDPPPTQVTVLTPPTPPQQRTCRDHAGSRAQDWSRSPGSHHLRRGHRSDLPSRRRHPDAIRATIPDHPARSAAGNPPPRRQCLHRHGCTSTRRLQIHHVIPWSEGGPTDHDNLITLCWYHPQIVVHRQGFRPYRHPKRSRIRFRRAGRAPPVE